MEVDVIVANFHSKTLFWILFDGIWSDKRFKFVSNSADKHVTFVFLFLATHVEPSDEKFCLIFEVMLRASSVLLTACL